MGTRKRRLVDSIPELADAYVEGCRRLVERGATGADQPNWYAVAKEEDGKERDLTSTEMGALAEVPRHQDPFALARERLSRLVRPSK